MGTQNENNFFSGFNIESIEKDLSIKVPETDSSKSGDEGDDKNVSEKNNEDKKTIGGLSPFYMSQKIAIPENEEEWKGITKGEKKEDNGEEDINTGGDNTQKDTTNGQEKEDALITEDSPLYLHAATLQEEGILPTLDPNQLKGKKTSEAVKYIIDQQKKFVDDGRNEYLNTLTDRQKEFLEMIELGIPQEEVEHHVRVEDAYGKITDEILSNDENLQKEIITQNYMLKGISDSKIQVFIKSAEDDDKLFEESKDALTDINAYIAEQKNASINAAKQAQIDADDKEKKLQEKINDTISGLTEIFPGIKLSAAEKTKLNEYMTKPVTEKVINGKRVPIDIINKVRMDDPISFNMRTAYFIMMGLYDKNADLSKFTKLATTSAAQRLTKKLQGGEPAGQKTGLTIEKKQDSDKKQKIIFPKF